MAIWLRKSTATTIVVGPFVDSTDGATAETALTISQADVLIWKQGGTSFNAKNEVTSATHRSNGCYTVPLDATDTNTSGQLFVSIAEAGALPVRHDFQVVEQNQYDSVFSTDFLHVDVLAIDGVTNAADRLGRAAALIIPGTIHDDGGTYTGTTTVFYSDDITEATADHYIGRVITFLTGDLLGQSTVITDYALTGGLYGTFTVTALTEAPANNATFVIS